MKITPVNAMLVVEQYDKGRKRAQEGGPFTSVIASANFGIVKYSSNENYPPGAQVYFGSEHQKLVVEGAEVLVMKETNVIALAAE